MHTQVGQLKSLIQMWQKCNKPYIRDEEITIQNWTFQEKINMFKVKCWHVIIQDIIFWEISKEMIYKDLKENTNCILIEVISNIHCFCTFHKISLSSLHESLPHEHWRPTQYWCIIKQISYYRKLISIPMLLKMLKILTLDILYSWGSTRNFLCYRSCYILSLNYYKVQYYPEN